MNTSNTKRKIAETVVGAAVGAAIAGPAGAVAGGLVGSQVAAHTSHSGERERSPESTENAAPDPIVHANLRRILVPTDFSPSALGTLRFAREWAARFGSEICLLHVIEPINTLEGFGPEPATALLPPVDAQAPARAELEKIVREELSPAVKSSIHLREGTAWDRIAVAAKELDVDLIILATHGRTGLAHALLGSTAERVVRHAPCPVLTLRRAQ